MKEGEERREREREKRQPAHKLTKGGATRSTPPEQTFHTRTAKFLAPVRMWRPSPEKATSEIIPGFCISRTTIGDRPPLSLCSLVDILNGRSRAHRRGMSRLLFFAAVAHASMVDGWMLVYLSRFLARSTMRHKAVPQQSPPSHSSPSQNNLQTLPVQTFKSAAQPEPIRRLRHP